MEGGDEHDGAQSTSTVRAPASASSGDACFSLRASRFNPLMNLVDVRGCGRWCEEWHGLGSASDRRRVALGCGLPPLSLRSGSQDSGRERNGRSPQPPQFRLAGRTRPANALGGAEGRYAGISWPARLRGRQYGRVISSLSRAWRMSGARSLFARSFTARAGSWDGWVRRAGVTLRGASVDESPHCYKRRCWGI